MATPTARRLCPRRATGENAATRKKLGKVPAQTRAARAAWRRSKRWEPPQATRWRPPTATADCDGRTDGRSGSGGEGRRASPSRRREGRGTRRTRTAACRRGRGGRGATRTRLGNTATTTNTATGQQHTARAHGTDTGRGQPQTINGRQSEETSSGVGYRYKIILARTSRAVKERRDGVQWTAAPPTCAGQTARRTPSPKRVNNLR